MLQEISITDFAIIEKLHVDFSTGMTVLTGETGAGKSIIIDAVGLLAGGRGSQHFIRTGANKAILQGLFQVDSAGLTAQKLDQFGINHDDDSVILQRELYRNGRNICRINGMLVNTNTLKQVGETLVDIYGQNEHQALMHSEQHLPLLDEYLGSQLKPLLTKYQQQYQQYLKLRRQQQHKQANEKEWAQRLDMLKYQAHEIEQADLHEHEETELLAERERLTNFQTINENLSQGLADLEGDDNFAPLDMIGNAVSAVSNIETLDPAFKKISENIQGAYYMLQDAESELSNQLDSLEYDPERLNVVEARLNIIFELKHKYGDSVQQILDYHTKITGELADMQSSASSDQDLEQLVAKKRQDLVNQAQQLTKLRAQGARQLEAAVHHQLRDLYMEKTEFSVVQHSLAQGQLNERGADQIEFYLRTNPGEAKLPLNKIASGGELSRIMLALKTIFSKIQGVTSIIFDEVDTGVSGRVAQAIADKIHRISQQSQALCITHLPQVAAMADHQYYIAKHVDHHNRTETTIQGLTGQERVQELARMLAGTTVTKLTLEHAQELLNLADQAKKAP